MVESEKMCNVLKIAQWSNLKYQASNLRKNLDEQDRLKQISYKSQERTFCKKLIETQKSEYWADHF